MHNVNMPQRSVIKATDSRNITIGTVVADGFDNLLDSERSDNIRFGSAHLTSPVPDESANQNNRRQWYERPIWKWAIGIVGTVIAGLAVWAISSALG